MSHLTAEQRSAMLDGALSGAARESAERHLAACASCREALAELSALDADLRTSLAHDPGDAYFETFAARVEDRIRAAGLSGAQSRLGGGGWSWLRSPRRLGWAGAVAAVVVGAGVVMLTSREAPMPELSSSLAGRAEQRAQAPEAPSEDAAQNRATEGTTSSGAMDSRVSEREAKPETNLRERQVAVEEALPSELARGASPKRLVEVRRNASGEDVPVGAAESPFATAPRPEAGAGGELRAAKPKAAAPLVTTPAPDVDVAKSLARSADEAVSQAPSMSFSDGARLCGRVVDPQGRPVAGAVVALVERGRTATADGDGRFCLDAPSGVHALTAMAVGYSTEWLQVRFDPSSTAQVTLRPVSVLGGRALALEKDDSQAQSMDKKQMSQFKLSEADVSQAERLSARADSLGTAPAFDAAAAAWDRVVRTSRDPARLPARYRLAEARYRAWRAGPTAARARSARLAFDDYLAATPAGAAKDQVAEWRRLLR